MRNRGLIFTLLVIFALICAYNLYYTVMRLSTDSMLNDMTVEQRVNWFKDQENFDAYKKYRENSMSLGLDLQGGMFVTLEVGIDEVIRANAYDPKDTLINNAIAKANALTSSNSSDYVDLFVQSFKQLAPQAKLSTYFAQGLGLTFEASDDQVLKALKEKADKAIDQTFDVLRKRIDRFGVASPTIQKYGSNRILVELPGVKDSDRVRKLLRGTAKLEFWPTYPVKDAFQYLEKANEAIRKVKGIVVDTANVNLASNDSTKSDSSKKDTTLVQKQAKDTAKKDTANLTDEQKREKFKKENPLFAKLAFPNFEGMKGNEPIVGYALISDTAEVNKMLALPEVQNVLPDDIRFLWTAKPEIPSSQYLTLISIKTNRDNKAPLDGSTVVEARQDFDPQNRNMPIVSMSMNVEGAKKWKKMTTDYLNKSIAVVLDGYVYSYPTVNSVIPNGQSQISGNFTIEEAKDLATILTSGKMEAPARIEGEEIVGASLGQDTINQGIISFIAGFLIVTLFMLLYYRTAGLIADIALIFNLFFIFGISSAFNVVLTLPGIAGIVLTMGMAVDANILIYERIREELNAGKSIKFSVSEGFSKSLSAILDSNITTFLTGLVLYNFGTGPIKGFAVTLMIGIVTTLIAALLVTRVIVEYVIKNENSIKKLQFGNIVLYQKLINANFNFMGIRKKVYAIFGSLLALYLIFIFSFGFKYSVDFVGGRQFVVQYDPSEIELDQVRSSLTKAFDNNMPIIKTVGNKNQIMITTNYLVDQQDADDKVASKIIETLKKEKSTPNPKILKSTKVGPTIARDIVIGAYYSVIFSLLIIFLYILLRFSRWQFGLGAIVSLLFNVFTVMGLFSLFSYLDILPFSLELDQSFIAAILTVVGYDINDTVVVYDRIREIIQDSKSKLNYEQVFNNGVNQTLSRTVITGATTILSALILFLFGGEVIRGFIFAMLIGFIVGIFTSIFVASPVSLDLIKNSEKS